MLLLPPPLLGSKRLRKKLVFLHRVFTQDYMTAVLYERLHNFII
jgi:hypothetical protein